MWRCGVVSKGGLMVSPKVKMQSIELVQKESDPRFDHRIIFRK